MDYLPNITLIRELAAEQLAVAEWDEARAEELARQQRMMLNAAKRDRGTRDLIVGLVVNDIEGMDDLIQRYAAGESADAVRDQFKDMADRAVAVLAEQRLPVHLRD